MKIDIRPPLTFLVATLFTWLVCWTLHRWNVQTVWWMVPLIVTEILVGIWLGFYLVWKIDVRR